MSIVAIIAMSHRVSSMLTFLVGVGLEVTFCSLKICSFFHWPCWIFVVHPHVFSFLDRVIIIRVRAFAHPTGPSPFLVAEEIEWLISHSIIFPVMVVSNIS